MKKLIAGNWKMNMGGADAKDFAVSLKQAVIDPACEVLVCVPFTAIPDVASVLNGSKISVGAQNVSWADSGAFTGEISADMLHYAGATHAIVGHSERRAMFGETDETVKKRTLKALEKGITPIVCIGETLSQRKGGLTEKVLKSQLDGAFDGFALQQMQRLVIAYEPVWAIGTGETATAQQAGDTVAFIRDCLNKMFGYSPRILYGGSMNASNAAELLNAGIDGGLIGGASLKIADFKAIIGAAK
ncbi:triosephosphate isomerase [Holotrichia oblita]|nr:triosephosphate isomerase [Holotrichia oblita]